MKSRSEEFEEWGTEVIFGRAKGFRASMMRMVLRGASWLFRLVVLARLYLFHSSIAKQARLGTLVVSVGNITVGGTGKTPVVELLARTLTQRGRKVAILTRGYKSADQDKPQEWKDKDGRPAGKPAKDRQRRGNALPGPPAFRGRTLHACQEPGRRGGSGGQEPHQVRHLRH